MENIVKIEDLDAVVCATIQKVYAGVKAARDAGIQAEIPDKITFDILVIKNWQSMEIASGHTTVGNENMTGAGTESSTTQTTDNTTSQESKTNTGTTTTSDSGSTSHTGGTLTNTIVTNYENLD